jgi:hypothetical protein
MAGGQDGPEWAVFIGGNTNDSVIRDIESKVAPAAFCAIHALPGG